ncbi:MAG: SpoVG family protein [Lachnospiraceae bacterium]|nr:SpoVG family protein [Lachnospiraceae bacterium]
MRYAITVNEVKGSNNGLKGFAAITLGDSFKITNVAIMQNQDTGELFVSMPRYKTNEKDENEKDVYQDICNPITKEFREELYGDILKAFEEHNEKKNKSAEQIPSEMPQFTVKVVPYTQEGSNVIGFARIYFEDCFVVSNVTIIQGKESAFVSMPSYKTKDVDENNKPIYRDICYSITKGFREKLYGTILETHQMEREKRLQDASEKSMNRREQMQKEMQEQEELDKAKKPESKPKKSKGK